MNLILVGLLIILLAFAWWQNRRVGRARCALNKKLQEAPAKVMSAVRVVARANRDRSATDFVGNGESALVVDLIDVNGDGDEELLLQQPTGAHESELRIFAWQGGEFKEIAQLHVSTPGGFDFGDFDSDGRVEIKAEEVDRSTGDPYVSAPRIMVLFRWDGAGFVELARQRASVAPQQLPTALGIAASADYTSKGQYGVN